MESLYLNLRDPLAMADFFDRWSGFASEEVRQQTEAVVKGMDQRQDISRGELNQAVVEFARAVWPVRYAVDRFFSKEGAGIEWDAVVKAVRRSTAQLMLRFQETSEVHGVDQLLGHSDVDTVLHEDEIHEIQEVRHHIREDYCRAHRKQLEPLIQEAQVLMAKFVDEIAAMRQTAEGLPALLQEELYSKVTRYEDRVLFGGEYVPSETLEDELKYYREQEALPL